jgi:L-amino acid N-acyltransferase YncA
MLARLAVAADEEAVVGLARMQVEETLPHLDFSEEATRETFQQAVRHADPTIFVCEGPGREVVGYLMALANGYAFTSGLFVVQEALYVRPDKRGTRAAAHLVKQFVQWGEHMQAREIIFGISNDFQPDRTARFFELTAGAKTVGYYLKKVR